MKETQSEDQGSKRNRREAQCHQGRDAVCPPLLGAQSLQQSLAQTRGWRQWEEGNGGAEQGLWSLNQEGGPSLGLTGDSSKEPDLSKALKEKRESGSKHGAGGVAWQARGTVTWNTLRRECGPGGSQGGTEEGP